MADPVIDFYKVHLPNSEIKGSQLIAPCPFCKDEGANRGKIAVSVAPKSFFKGYFQCTSHCIEGGYALWFAKLMRIDPNEVPGYESQDLEQNIDYPENKINGEIDGFQLKMGEEGLAYFGRASISEETLSRLKVGYNGRYIVYPYYQMDSNVYSARCVHPENSDDYFWYGDDRFMAGPSGLFNLEELIRCNGGSLFLCEGEQNLLVIKNLGFPGIAVDQISHLEIIDAPYFSSIKNLFIVVRNSQESVTAAKVFASKVGYKVRILEWNKEHDKDITLFQLAEENKQDFVEKFKRMILASKPFSPFDPPQREYTRFHMRLTEEAENTYQNLHSGFSLLDARTKGIHGINILGGGPKVGKSCFMIQIATEMALRQIPVLYYDFENGKQRILHRTMSRLTRVETDSLRRKSLSDKQRKILAAKQGEFLKMLKYFRVINDRKLNPDLMRKHIDFLRHETQHDYPVVVIDSLHKLPFKDMSQKRSGIDGWLRQIESIRDELQVSFLVISELSRGESGEYDSEPHMGLFKGSGDIEYSADNAMVLIADWDHMQEDMSKRVNNLWLVASRESSPGLVGKYRLDYPYWGFVEEKNSD